MPSDLIKFVMACDKKRKNPNFLIKEEFNSLNLVQQESILQSILSTSITQQAIPGQALAALSPEQNMVRALQFALGDNTQLDTVQTVQMGCAGTIENLSQESEFFDVYSSGFVPIHYIDGKCFVHHGGKEYQAHLTQADGYVAVSFEVPSIREEFLSNLDKSYYQLLVGLGKVIRDEMIDRAMIFEVAKTITPDSKNFSTVDKAKLCSSFDRKTTFLHLAAPKMTVAQLENFLKDTKSSYLDLTDNEGKRAIDVVANSPEKVAAIRKHMFRDKIIFNDAGIDTHTPAIHRTVDQSLVRLAGNILNISTAEKATTIVVDHQRIKPSIDEIMLNIEGSLTKVIGYNNEKLLHYISLLLTEAEKGLSVDSPQMQKILKFKRFQLKTAADLIEDVIHEGHTGNQYKYFNDVNVANSNGLTIKEMIAFTYSSLIDYDKLVVGYKIDETGKSVVKKFTELETEQEKESFLRAVKLKFFDALYTIRRGYNVDHKEDKPELYEFTENTDHNICSGGTINKLAYALNGIHEYVDIKIITPQTFKFRVQREFLALIKPIILKITQEDKIKAGLWITDWKASNVMPLELQGMIYNHLIEEFKKADNPIILEYREFFPIDKNGDPILTHTRDAIKEYNYPKGKIAETALSADSFVEYIRSNKDLNKLPKFMRSENGDYQLVLELLFKQRPEIIHTLLDKKYCLEKEYITVNGKMTSIMDIYLQHYKTELVTNKNYFDNALSEAISYKLYTPALKKFFSSLDNEQFATCAGYASTMAIHFPTSCPAIIRTIPKERVSSMLTAVDYIAKANPKYIPAIIKAIPESELDLFVGIIGEVIKDQPAEFYKIAKSISAKKIPVFQEMISEYIRDNPENLALIMEVIPKNKFDLFIEPISAVIKAKNLSEDELEEEIIQCFKYIPEQYHPIIIEKSAPSQQLNTANMSISENTIEQSWVNRVGGSKRKAENKDLNSSSKLQDTRDI